MQSAIISSEQIRALRQTMGLTQSELAERLGATSAAVARWERGERQPRAEAARRLAAWLAQSSPENGLGVPETAFAASTELTELAAEVGVDLKSLYTSVGTAAVRAELKRLWQEKNAIAIAERNTYIEENGIPLSELRAW